MFDIRVTDNTSAPAIQGELIASFKTFGGAKLRLKAEIKRHSGKHVIIIDGQQNLAFWGDYWSRSDNSQTIVNPPSYAVTPILQHTPIQEKAVAKRSIKC